MAVVGFSFLVLGQDGFSGYKAIAFASGSIDLVALAGLFFYIRSKPVVSRYLWRVVLVILVIKMVGPTIGLVRNALTFTGVEQRVALVAALSSLWGVPLIHAIWRYSFASELWRIRADPA